VNLNASGQAIYTSPGFNAGKYTLIAIYSGGASFTTSMSASLVETVNKVPCLRRRNRRSIRRQVGKPYCSVSPSALLGQDPGLQPEPFPFISVPNCSVCGH
jgi:hypothetical protein